MDSIVVSSFPCQSHWFHLSFRQNIPLYWLVNSNLHHGYDDHQMSPICWVASSPTIIDQQGCLNTAQFGSHPWQDIFQTDSVWIKRLQSLQTSNATQNPRHRVQLDHQSPLQSTAEPAACLLGPQCGLTLPTTEDTATQARSGTRAIGHTYIEAG